MGKAAAIGAIVLSATTIVLFMTADAGAWQVRHHHAYAPPPPSVDRAPGWEIRELTRRAQDEPGVTSELSPGAKQTATGGPSGGVPGFSGH